MVILATVSIFLLLSFRPGKGPKWPPQVYDTASNPFKAEAVLLGRALFYDPILSRDSSVSCASCHSPYSAFAHIDHPLSHGIDNQIGFRNAPPLFNLAWNSSFMWDGAIDHLDMQPLAPINHPGEMGLTTVEAVSRLRSSDLYRGLFQNAYGDSLANGKTMLKAIAGFMLTLVSNRSKYDSVQLGTSVFSEQEQEGYRLFKAHCANCHQEPLFTNDRFENNGLKPDTALKDLGRAKVTNDAKDAYRFRVPSLRNVEYTYPYMHDGRFARLKQVVDHYVSGIDRSKTLSKPLLEPILLDTRQRVDLIAFLLTLSDRAFVFDTAHQFPRQLFFPKPKG